LGGSTAPNERSGNSIGSCAILRDFGYDVELLSRDQVDEKALLNLKGVVRTSHTTLNGRCYQNLDGFAAATEWGPLTCERVIPEESLGEADGL
jgi:hypothetical protein